MVSGYVYKPLCHAKDQRLKQTLFYKNSFFFVKREVPSHFRQACVMLNLMRLMSVLRINVLFLLSKKTLLYTDYDMFIFKKSAHNRLSVKFVRHRHGHRPCFSGDYIIQVLQLARIFLSKCFPIKELMLHNSL